MDFGSIRMAATNGPRHTNKDAEGRMSAATGPSSSATFSLLKETQNFARQPGLKPCFTPVQSPQSNCMSEAFVMTLKRDYVQVTPLPDAQTALGLIGGQIEDYSAPRGIQS